MNILVVGGAGYLGGAVTDILSQTKHKIRVYDALLYEEEYRKRIDFIYGDVRDHAKLLPHLKWADAVIYLAAVVGDAACAINPEISHDVNASQIEYLAKNYDGRIIFPSTCSVYGAQDVELDENSPINPLSVYAKTKLEAEKYLKDKNAIIFRLGTLFGLGDEYSRIRLDLVVNTMTAKAYSEGQLKVFGGKQYRPLLHVRDAAKIICESVGHKKTGIFNLRQTNINMIDLAQKVVKEFPGIKLEMVKMQFEDARNYRVKATKAQKELEFKPELDIETGIAELKNLLETGRIRDYESPRYTNVKYLSKYSTHKLKSIRDGKTSEEPYLINGGVVKDARGKVCFVNGFNFDGVQRFYMVENSQVGLIRAWHGHKHEAKYFMVLRGSAMISAVKVDDWEKPDKNAQVHRFFLDDQTPSVLYIPAGFANGVMNLSLGAQVMIFSNRTLEESKNDDYRFDPRYWDVAVFEDKC